MIIFLYLNIIIVDGTKQILIFLRSILIFCLQGYNSIFYINMTLLKINFKI